MYKTIILFLLFIFTLVSISVSTDNDVIKNKEKEIEKHFNENKKKLVYYMNEKERKAIINEKFRPYGDDVLNYLLPRLSSKNKNDDSSAAGYIFIEMKDISFPILQKKVFDKDPFLKAGIIHVMSYFDYKEFFQICLSSLDDKRVCVDDKYVSEKARWRVCDIVYKKFEDKIYEYLRKNGMSNNEANEYFYKNIGYMDGSDSPERRDLYIKNLKKWWNSNGKDVSSIYKSFYEKK